MSISWSVCCVDEVNSLVPYDGSGSWYTFFGIIGYAAVLTNLGVIIFTTDGSVLAVTDMYSKVVVFVVVEVGYVTVMPVRSHERQCLADYNFPLVYFGRQA